MKKWLLRGILILIILSILGLYIFELVVNKTEPTKYLFRALSVVCICCAGLIRSFNGEARRSLNFYDAQYREILQNAFVQQPFWRKKLLCAIRLYNEQRYDKALKYLWDLKERSQTAEDHYAVNLFAALCFTDMKIYPQAENIYQQLIFNELADSRIFSNLGHVQMQMGAEDKALINYEHALEYDRDNAYAYNNIAQAHFRMHDLEKAIPYALQALKLNPKLHPASSLLAIIYALLEDKENKEKYFHIAISNGKNPQELKQAIAYYLTAQSAAENGGEAETEPVN